MYCRSQLVRQIPLETENKTLAITKQGKARRIGQSTAARGRSFLTENFLSESEALISWQGIHVGAAGLPD